MQDELKMKIVLKLFIFCILWYQVLSNIINEKLKQFCIQNGHKQIVMKSENISTTFVRDMFLQGVSIKAFHTNRGLSLIFITFLYKRTVQLCTP